MRATFPLHRPVSGALGEAVSGKGVEIGRHGKWDLMGGLTALAVVVVAYTLLASKLDRWWITGHLGSRC